MDRLTRRKSGTENNILKVNTLTFQKSQQLLLQIYQDGHVCDIDTQQTFEAVRVKCHLCHPLSMLSVEFCCH